MDIFAVAAALGQGATTAVDETMAEFVPRPNFIEEVEKLLEGAKERAEVLQMQLDQREVLSHLPFPGRVELHLPCAHGNTA